MSYSVGGDGPRCGTTLVNADAGEIVLLLGARREIALLLGATPGEDLEAVPLAAPEAEFTVHGAVALDATWLVAYIVGIDSDSVGRVVPPHPDIPECPELIADVAVFEV